MATARKLPSGNWRTLVYIGNDENGKRQYQSFTASTKRESEFLAAEYLANKREKNSEITLGDAINDYIDSKDGVLSPKTIREYRRFRQLYCQKIMGIRLRDLTNEKLQSEITRESKHLSPKSIRNIYGLISVTLKTFQPNVRYDVTLPQKQKKEIVIPSQEKLLLLLDEVAGTRLEIPVLLGACAGLRRSEIAALDLGKDVDYQNSRITINKAMVNDSDGNWVIKSPKAYASYRTIDIPEWVTAKLSAARSDPDYKMMHPSHITTAFLKKIKKLGLGDITFHNLRHYYASLMLSLNVPDKYAMQRMGHSTPNMLKTVYQHLIDEKNIEVTATINSHFDIMQHEMQHKK